MTSEYERGHAAGREGDLKRHEWKLPAANWLRDEINETLGRYDIHPDVYQQDVRIDALCVVAVDKILSLLDSPPAPQGFATSAAEGQWIRDTEAGVYDTDMPAPVGVTVKPLVWGYHPAGTIAAPPTGHAYIIDTRMKGRVYSVKGFNPEREFGSLDEAKAAAQADYEARIMAALEPAPAEVTVQEAAKVLLDQPYSVMERAFDAMEARQGEGSDRIMAAALRALSEGTK